MHTQVQSSQDVTSVKFIKQFRTTWSILGTSNFNEFLEEIAILKIPDYNKSEITSTYKLMAEILAHLSEDVFMQILKDKITPAKKTQEEISIECQKIVDVFLSYYKIPALGLLFYNNSTIKNRADKIMILANLLYFNVDINQEEIGYLLNKATPTISSYIVKYSALKESNFESKQLMNDFKLIKNLISQNKENNK